MSEESTKNVPLGEIATSIGSQEATANPERDAADARKHYEEAVAEIKRLRRPNWMSDWLTSGPLVTGVGVTGSGVRELLDASGKRIEFQPFGVGQIGETQTATDMITLTIPREQFDQLSAKTREVLAQAALTQERIAKDQEEIDLLKTETRETLRRLRAA